MALWLAYNVRTWQILHQHLLPVTWHSSGWVDRITETFLRESLKTTLRWAQTLFPGIVQIQLYSFLFPGLPAPLDIAMYHFTTRTDSEKCITWAFCHWVDIAGYAIETDWIISGPPRLYYNLMRDYCCLHGWWPKCPIICGFLECGWFPLAKTMRAAVIFVNFGQRLHKLSSNCSYNECRWRGECRWCVLITDLGFILFTLYLPSQWQGLDWNEDQDRMWMWKTDAETHWPGRLFSELID